MYMYKWGTRPCDSIERRQFREILGPFSFRGYPYSRNFWVFFTSWATDKTQSCDVWCPKENLPWYKTLKHIIFYFPRPPRTGNRDRKRLKCRNSERNRPLFIQIIHHSSETYGDQSCHPLICLGWLTGTGCRGDGLARSMLQWTTRQARNHHLHPRWSEELKKMMNQEEEFESERVIVEQLAMGTLS